MTECQIYEFLLKESWEEFFLKPANTFQSHGVPQDVYSRVPYGDTFVYFKVQIRAGVLWVIDFTEDGRSPKRRRRRRAQRKLRKKVSTTH